MAVSASLGFQVVPVPETSDSNMARTSTTISEEVSYATASGSSEGFRSAYTSPVTAQRTASFGDAGPSPTVSVDSASFHTPEPYLSSSQEDLEHVSIIVEIPELTDSHNRDCYETDQPKLLLVEDGVEGQERKQTLDNEYHPHAGNHHNKSQGSSRRPPNEATPLLEQETSKSRGCCLLL